MRAYRSLFYLTLFFAISGGWGLFSCHHPKTDAQESDDFEIQIESLAPVCSSGIRGLYLVNDTVGWAGASKGTFLRMIDGKSWQADSISGYTHLDFRDVHAFDENTALLMAAGEEGRILRTDDGGRSWVEVYTQLDLGIFLDGMDFHLNVGYCYGDPMNGKFVVLRSDDLGKTWHELTSNELPGSMPKEAGFAASGTGIVVSENAAFFASGGDSISRIFAFNNGRWNVHDTPVRSAEGCGIFSVVRTNDRFVAVGGCYLDSANAEANCAISMDEGQSWKLVTEHQPRGYRSCVAYTKNADLLITCGRTGMEYSRNGGWDWIPMTDEGHYTCAMADSTGWAMGRGGKMAKLSWSAK